MSKVELTPAKLAKLRQKAETVKKLLQNPWKLDHYYVSDEESDFIAEADPATVLALVEEIEWFRHFVRETLDELHECYNEESCKICKEIDRVIESEATQ